MDQKEQLYRARYVVIFLIGIHFIKVGSAFKCYTCDDIHTSEDCMNVTDCRPDEICYIRADAYPSGEIRHSLGCMGNDAFVANEHTFCSETCQDDFCNLNGCRLPVSPTGKSRRPPRCLSCDLIGSPANCTNLVQCEENKVCFSHAVSVYGKVLYRMGCIDRQHCSDHPIQTANKTTGSVTIVGKRTTPELCSVCCMNDVCNMQDCHNHSQNGTGHELNLLGDNQTCFDRYPESCSAFGLMNKDACTLLPKVDVMCPQTCGICGHYGWSSWGSWSTCSRTCNDGVSQRSRSCLHQIAVTEHFNCTGPTTETKPCRERKCDVEGTWSVWAPWTSCSRQCNGTKSRQRYCRNPTLQHGNLYCVGDNVEETYCFFWLSNGSSCYLFGTSTMNFAVALTFCRQMGSTLVHIDSEGENTFISNHIKELAYDGSADWWIGMTDTQTEGEWMLTDTNTRATFTKWRVGEPSNSGRFREEDCAVTSSKYRWNDVNCQNDMNYPICEMQPIV